jgi:hypothetical protein
VLDEEGDEPPLEQPATTNDNTTHLAR